MRKGGAFSVTAVAVLLVTGRPVFCNAQPAANVVLFEKDPTIPMRDGISSSNFPRFDVNPNTGETLGKNRRMLTADNSIYHDASHPTRVILPIVPSKREEYP